VLAIVLAACVPGAPGGNGDPSGSPTLPPAAIPLEPANPGADPVSLLSWLFTPIFQVLFITLVLIDTAVGNIFIAIVLLTLLLRVILIPVFRRQLVSTRRMQLLAPEVREIQKRYKGDRARASAAQQELYRERGVNPLSGCLPLLLTLFLLIPMYSVFSQGLQNFNPQAMLEVAGFTILDLSCDPTPIVEAGGHVANPCLNPVAFGVDWGVPEVILGSPGALFSGFSLLALISALVQLVQSRMTLPKADAATADDPTARTQRQMAYFLPFISLIYGSILPAGLFIYWIVSTLFAIVQQYLIVGWGGMFPLFGWTPGFAADHSPRFPVTLPEPDPTRRSPKSALGGDVERQTSAERTIRRRGRSSRRGRRR
jgi:YidC/Oxa1 family membrane protein insertase